MATAEEPQKTVNGKPSLAKGEAWIDVATMAVLVVILIIVFFFIASAVSRVTYAVEASHHGCRPELASQALTRQLLWSKTLEPLQDALSGLTSTTAHEGAHAHHCAWRMATQHPEHGQRASAIPQDSSGSSAGDRSSATGESEQQQRVVLYRGLGMVPFRVLVRLKIFQLAGIAALAIPINTFLVEGAVSGVQTLMAVSLVVGCTVASVTLWYYSRRYVGELSLRRGRPPQAPRLCFSVMDFWGNREDNWVDPERMVPPLRNCTPQELQSIAEQTLLPVDVEGDRQYFLSLRHGHLVDRARLMAVLQGQSLKA